MYCIFVCSYLIIGSLKKRFSQHICIHVFFYFSFFFFKDNLLMEHQVVEAECNAILRDYARDVSPTFPMLIGEWALLKTEMQRPQAQLCNFSLAGDVWFTAANILHTNPNRGVRKGVLRQSYNLSTALLGNPAPTQRHSRTQGERPLSRVTTPLKTACLQPFPFYSV